MNKIDSILVMRETLYPKVSKNLIGSYEGIAYCFYCNLSLQYYIFRNSAHKKKN